MCGRAPCGWGRASRKLRASDVRRGSRERVCHRHETPWQQLGGTAAIRNSPGVYGSAYDAPDGQYSHRAELRRSSEETVYNSAGIAGACCAARAAGSNGQTRVAGRSFDVVKDDHAQHFFQAAQTPAPHARVVVHSARSLSAFRCGVPSLPQPRRAASRSWCTLVHLYTAFSCTLVSLPPTRLSPLRRSTRLLHCGGRCVTAVPCPSIR